MSSLFGNKQLRASVQLEVEAHMLDEKRDEGRYQDIILLILIYFRSQGLLTVAIEEFKKTQDTFFKLFKEEGIRFGNLENQSDSFDVALAANRSNGYICLPWQKMIRLTPLTASRRDIEEHFNPDEASIIRFLIPCILSAYNQAFWKLR